MYNDLTENEEAFLLDKYSHLGISVEDMEVRFILISFFLLINYEEVCRRKKRREYYSLHKK